MNKMFLKLGIFIVLAVLIGTVSFDAFAQQSSSSSGIQVNIPLGEGEGRLATPVKIVLLITALTFLPALFVTATSFTRIIVVFAFLRQSLGLQQSPPNQILIGLALFLTFSIMSPYFDRMYNNAITPYLDGQMDEKTAITETLKPLREFMYKQTREKDIQLMMEISRTEDVDSFEALPTSVLIPAFVVSELKTAFQIGFMIYIPFVVIDMMVGMVLLAMGMMVLPPVVISMPFKIMLFIMVNGWDLIIMSLWKSFQ